MSSNQKYRLKRRDPITAERCNSGTSCHQPEGRFLQKCLDRLTERHWITDFRSFRVGKSTRRFFYSQLEDERLESEWQWVVQAQRELGQVARSYHWIATELLSESATETWDARDYGRKLMRWAKRIDGPPALLDAN